MAANIHPIPHLPTKALGDPDFVYTAPLMFAYAAFYKESRMKFIDPRNPTGNPGVWGTHHAYPNRFGAKNKGAHIRHKEHAGYGRQEAS
jgi:hypothetical protein